MDNSISADYSQSPNQQLFLHNNINNITDPDRFKHSNLKHKLGFKPLTLSIKPANSIQESSSQRINSNYDDLSQVNRGTADAHNINEYSDRDGTSHQYDKDVQTAAFPDVIEIPSDPYDNRTGEQHFCNGYSECAHVANRTERTILPDLKQYPFPDDIKNQADVIYNKMRYQVRRGKIRFQMLFFCVYYAHVELERDVNPIQLGALFGLTQGEVQRCDSLFSPLQTGYRPPSKNTSPLGYLPDYCQNMDLSQEAIDEIMKMSASILRKDTTLYQENPQTVAAGLLRYFTVTNGIITDDPQKITRVTNRSTVTIDGMFRRIATVDNS